MKYGLCIVCLLGATCFPVWGAGFLRADASFPKTYDDVSFIDRMLNEATSYEDWEPEYDASGHCIRGCAYRGMKIEDDLAMMERQTRTALNALAAAGVSLPTSAPDVLYTPQVQPKTVPSTTTPTSNAPTPSSASNVHAPQVAHVCNPNNPDIKRGQTYPVGEPVIGHPRISSPFGDRIHPVTGRRTPHRGIDLSVPTGTDIFTPANGTVAAVWTDNTCGRGIRITHTGGFETVYCHLSEQLVKSGEHVDAGCCIGKSGNTGRSTGPHLHYGIKQDGTYVNPTRFMGRS